MNKYCSRISVFLLPFVFFLFSCASRNNLIYFYNSTNINSKDSSSKYTPTLKSDDLLSIIVSTIDPDAAKPFNLSVVSYSTNGQITGIPTIQGYLIDSEGMIDFPVIGKIKLAGLSRSEATELLKEKLNVYISNPIVNVRILNFKISVIGDVRNPGSYTIPNERITILEALGLAGDINITGIRKNILVIREKNGVKNGYRVDITSSDILNSPVYYLNQNDVVYVEPNKTKINSSKSSSNTSIILTSIAVLISAINTYLNVTK